MLDRTILTQGLVSLPSSHCVCAEQHSEPGYAPHVLRLLHMSSDCSTCPPPAKVTLTLCSSPLQESPSLWHFMTTRRGQKTTSASGKENASRSSTARKSLQLLISGGGGQVHKDLAWQLEGYQFESRQDQVLPRCP